VAIAAAKPGIAIEIPEHSALAIGLNIKGPGNGLHGVAGGTDARNVDDQLECKAHQCWSQLDFSTGTSPSPWHR
jgi:hypothetical protein